eukprot:CAMPEP_0179471460 /NCGR_PEP_ID=MMETSP0799-20121207/51691_1 /TAXON_ID=46947 /ORGANISM="Geminigera cryophila, Strain CCMP2564" /LENGTH=91 /DNA_ID=CAMNT_0021279095 /DNA_START=470 /DNA_END=745 /DNA_ORIENTATION=-
MELAVAPPDLPRLAVGAARANHDSTQAVDSVFAIARAHCLGNARGDNKLANYLVEAVGCAFCIHAPWHYLRRHLLGVDQQLQAPATLPLVG